MNTPGLSFDLDGRGVATVTFERPDKRNAFDADMRQALAAMLRRYAGDAAVRVVVLRAAGQHFCAGSDLDSAIRQTPSQRLEMLVRLERLRQPTIALIQGGCIGAGIGFPACCDIVLATPDAFFSVPEVRLGLAPGALTPLLVRAIGARALRRYGLTAERFDARQAQHLGLVHEVVEADMLDAKLQQCIDALLGGAPGAMAALKATIARSVASPDLLALVDQLAIEEASQPLSDEAREGIASFRERRKPDWHRHSPAKRPPGSRRG